jgi:hypothetical protein
MFSLKKNKIGFKNSSFKDSGLGFAFGAFLTLGVFIFGFCSLAAWTNPTQNPIGGNVAPPILVGTSTAPYTQTRYGTLKLGTTTPSIVTSNLYVYSGGISIGTSTPATTNELVVDNTSNTSIAASLGFVSWLRAPSSGNDAVNMAWAEGRYANGSVPPGWVLAGAGNGFAKPTSTIFLVGTGNVGIGSTNPGAKLDVNGILNVGTAVNTGSITVGTSQVIAVTASPLTMTLNGGGFTNVVIPSGNVGIGTTVPGAKLELSYDSTSNVPIRFTDTKAAAPHVWDIGAGFAVNNNFTIYDRTNTATRFTIDGSGNVGIGTTNPASLLELAKVGSAGTAPQLSISGYNNNVSSHGYLSFNSSYGTSIGSFVTTVGGTIFGNIDGNGVNTGNTAANATRIFFQQDGAAGATFVPGLIAFYTGSNAAAPVEQMRINNAGYVGIGTINPKVLLSLGGNGTDAGTQTWANAANTVQGGLTFDTGNNYVIFGATTTNTSLQFLAGNSVRMMLSGSTGNVGIATNSPAVYRLDVAGSGRFWGDVKVTGQITAGSGDVAEEFYTDQNYPAGTVLVMDDKGYKSARACTKKYDQTVIGVISAQPGMIVGAVEGKYTAPVALTGVIKVLVNSTGGKIHQGDLLTTSAISGEAMKATNPKVGTSIGKALEDDTGKGWVMAIVNLK